MAGEKLVELMKTAGRNGIPDTELTDLVYGTVESTKPLVVVADKDPKLRLTETFLKLSPLCLEKSFTIPAWETNDESAHSYTIPQHKVIVWRGLRKGDRVAMLRCAKGGIYYVLQREGAL